MELSLLPSLAEAEAVSCQGVVRLALLTNQRFVTNLDKTLPKQLEPVTATVNPLGPSGAQRERFRKLVVQRAVTEALAVTPSTLPRSSDAFERWVRAGLPRAEASLADVVRISNAIHVELRETRTALTNAAKQPSGAAAVRDMQAQLEQLLPEDALLHVSLAQLAHFPRYLRGIRLRLSRAVTDPRKDADKAASFIPVWQLFLQQAPSLSADEIAQLRWAFEELRIATFAPELKPAYPVSAAKLRTALG